MKDTTASEFSQSVSQADKPAGCRIAKGSTYR